MNTRDSCTRFGRWPSSSGPAPEGWDAPEVRVSVDPEYDAYRHAETQRLADAAGMRSIDTFRDAFACMRRLDLVLTAHSGLHVVNPAAPRAWEILSVDEKTARTWQEGALQDVVGHLWPDLMQLLRRAPDGALRTTARLSPSIRR